MIKRIFALIIFEFMLLTGGAIAKEVSPEKIPSATTITAAQAKALFGKGVSFVDALASGSVFAKHQARDLSFENIHTGEKVGFTCWQNGGYVAEALKGFDHLLRDHRTDELLPIDRPLFDQLHRLKPLIGSNQPFQVISGYRPARTNAMPARRSGGVSRRSYHQFGMAIDIQLPETGLRDLRKAALSMKAGGVGYYRRSNFVHLDTGRPRFW